MSRFIEVGNAVFLLLRQIRIARYVWKLQVHTEPFADTYARIFLLWGSFQGV